MAYKSISVLPDVESELRKLAAEITIETGTRPTVSDLIMQGIKLIREDSRSQETCQS